MEFSKIAPFEGKLIVLVLVLVSCWSCLADEHHRATNLHNGNLKTSGEDANYWRQLGQQLLQDEIRRQRYERIDTAAKNVILFLGDGLSIATMTASRIYKGQKEGGTGEEASLTFEKFPYAALSKTYCTNAQVPDSACSAIAFLCGVKTVAETLGMDYNVEYKNCSTQNNPAFHVDSIMAWAQAANKGTGIVTTTRVTHATPAGTYAHVASRYWEDDISVSLDGADPSTCDDVAEQLVLKSPGKNFKVVMGGGRAILTPNTVLDPETGTKGRRHDGKNLIDQWVADHPTGAYTTTRDELINLDVATIDSLLGLFSPSHMEYFLESGAANNPTLEEMTRTAIRMLQKESNGYVLLVEGGRIDQAHHDGRAKLALEETYQFDLAIAAALNMTNREDTLIVVTADHSHTMTINGYPDRGNPILGLVELFGSVTLSSDQKPYTTLSYANGPGHFEAFADGTRANLTGIDTTADSYKQQATVPLETESHGGDDVAIFAIGPQAHLFQGAYEQHYIAHVMAYAACIGPGLTFCSDPTAPLASTVPTVTSTTSPSSSSPIRIDIFLSVGVIFSFLLIQRLQ